jgi:hypothetical protein
VSQLCSELPKFPIRIRPPSDRQSEVAAKDPGDNPVNERQVSAQGKHRDSMRCVWAYAGQFPQPRQAPRHLPSGSKGAPQASKCRSTAGQAQRSDDSSNRSYACTCQTLWGRPAGQETLVDSYGMLPASALEQHIPDQDRVGIASLPPREGTTLLPMPPEHYPTELTDLVYSSHGAFSPSRQSDATVIMPSQEQRGKGPGK